MYLEVLGLLVLHESRFIAEHTCRSSSTKGGCSSSLFFLFLTITAPSQVTHDLLATGRR